MTRAEILLCSDLDRTLIPNGHQPESDTARARLRHLADRPEIALAYVSGRHKALLQEAIATWELPVPDFAIGDVGTTIYRIDGEDWQPRDDWSAEIASDWRGLGHDQLAELFGDLETLTLQEPEKQNTFKLSYYAPADTARDPLLTVMNQRLDNLGVRGSLIWSIDEVAGIGLLDVLPERATKRHAIEFLMQREGFDAGHTVFAGDSGNDLPVLTSGLKAVLVANARDEVRDEAVSRLEHQGLADRLYVARGDFLGMNGNYSAGVLEGLAHFLPQTRDWMQLT